MGYFGNDYTNYLNQIFRKNDISAIEDMLNSIPTHTYGVITPHEIATWACSQTGQQILKEWGQMPFDHQFRSVFPKTYAFKEGAKKSIREYSKREYNATQNNFNGPVYNGPVHYGDSVSITNGDYVKGDKNITSPPSQPAEREADRHYLMVRMKNEAPSGYQAVKKALENGIAEFENGKFNFNCDKGTVALIFGESGFTEAKTLVQYITIKGENVRLATFNNWSKNTPPQEWETIKRILFE
jgi:hypothetical protein